MPNHVTNNLTFYRDNCYSPVSPELFRHICMVLQGDDPDRSYGSVDFNVLIPMPDELKNIEASSRGENGYALYARYMHASSGASEEEKARLEAYLREGVDNETWELGKRYYENSQKYGHTTWYGWANQHWLTKWNAYDCSHNEHCRRLTFLTAWSAPDPVIKRISKRFPELTILHEWADENVGYNTGIIEYTDGVAVDENIPEEGSTEAYDMSASILGIDLEDYGLVLGDDGEYHEEEV